VLRNEATWTGGPDGMPVPAMGLFGFELTSDKQWYWVVALAAFGQRLGLA
jgi:branched-chain amino acid transport system permease protein